MEEEPSNADNEYREYVLARWLALVRTAYLLTGDEYLAEDLAQIALTKVYTSWRRIRRVDNLDAYVRRIMVNANTGRFRKRRVAEHLSATPPDGASHEPHAPLAQRSVLMAELAQLPSRQRAIVVLRFWEDLSEKQVASMLSCSTGTVKSQTSKALARLRSSPALSVIEPPDRLDESAHAARRGETRDGGIRK